MTRDAIGYTIGGWSPETCALLTFLSEHEEVSSADCAQVLGSKRYQYASDRLNMLYVHGLVNKRLDEDSVATRWMWSLAHG